MWRTIEFERGVFIDHKVEEFGIRKMELLKNYYRMKVGGSSKAV
jgi:hypothetical protein